MRLRHLLGVAALAGALALLAVSLPGVAAPSAPAAPSAAKASAAACTQAEALKAGAPYAFYPDKPAVRLALCGQFLGPGSEAMVVLLGFPTCWPVQNWAVFGPSGSGWKLVKEIPAYLIPPLRAVPNSAGGADIEETTAVHRAGDARCLPTGGTRSRTWHWSGTGLVASAWKQVKPPDPVRHAHFYTRAGVECFGSDEQSAGAQRGVYCQGYTPAPALVGKNARLTVTGKVTLCRNRSIRDNRCNLGNSGEVDRPALLALGKQVEFGRFRCRVLATGVECTIVRSGKGFLIGKTALRRLP